MTDKLKDAYDCGCKAFKLGKSIHYNPYRNTGKEDFLLDESWNNGYKKSKSDALNALTS